MVKSNFNHIILSQYVICILKRTKIKLIINVLFCKTIKIALVQIRLFKMFNLNLCLF